jgi:hypothetical protein
MPSRMMEFQEALENYSVVMLKLWPLDDTPHNIRRTLLYNNYAGQTGEDEKGRLRYVYNNFFFNIQPATMSSF